MGPEGSSRGAEVSFSQPATPGLRTGTGHALSKRPGMVVQAPGALRKRVPRHGCPIPTPRDGRPGLREGLPTPLRFRLILLGSAGELAPLATEAVARMAHDGLGASRCRLERAHAEAEEPAVPWPTFGVSPAGPGHPVSRGQPMRQLDLPERIRRAAHRHVAVEHLDAPREMSPAVEDSGTAERTEAVTEHARRLEVEVHRVRCYDLHRYGGRQGGAIRQVTWWARSGCAVR